MTARRPAPLRTTELTAPPYRRSLDLAPAELPAAARSLLHDGYRLALVTVGGVEGESSGHRLVYLFTGAAPDRRMELVIRTEPGVKAIPSLAAWSFAAGRFEQLIFDLHGLVSSPVPFTEPPAAVDRHTAGTPPDGETAGPPALGADATFDPPGNAADRRAGIEPRSHDGERSSACRPKWTGHGAGEEFLRVNATRPAGCLFERAIAGRQVIEAVAQVEAAQAHTPVGHTLAYCLAVEDAYRWRTSARVDAARAVLLELERLLNHVTDLGELCRHGGYHLGHETARKLRHKILGLNNDVAGHPHLCGAVSAGGVRIRSLPSAHDLWTIAAEATRLVARAINETALRERFTGNAILTRTHAQDCGALGFVARASGVNIDARRDHPFHQATRSVAPTLRHDGDVLARFVARAEEIVDGVRLMVLLLDEARIGAVLPDPRRAPPGRAVHGIGVVEGWRGTIVHRIEAAADGTITDLRIVDPAFLTLPALPFALSSVRSGDLGLAKASFNAAHSGRSTSM